MRVTASSLRRELSQRNIERARVWAHEVSYGDIPSVLYQREGNIHGNFLPASYRAICSRPDWHRRLEKKYTGDRWIARSWGRTRSELDCANSSDALLMNIFCYPRVLHRPQLCALLGIERGQLPEFGFRPRIPLLNGGCDRTEVDMRLGDLLVEAKLTETGFRPATFRLLSRYREVRELPISGNIVHAYQLIRGVLAAHSTESSFLLLCDGRRTDLIESWFQIMRAVRSYSLRNRLKLLSWQEIARTLPKSLENFLSEKYGVSPS